MITGVEGISISYIFTRYSHEISLALYKYTQFDEMFRKIDLFLLARFTWYKNIIFQKKKEKKKK